MKNSIALVLIMMSLGAKAQDPEVVSSPVEHLFVPAGFDNNDNVEVVVTGNFPTPCYSRNKVDVAVIGDNISISISALVRKNEKENACPQMLVPYKEVVTIGNLQGGNYKITVNPKDEHQLKDDLFITEASSNAIDDNIYALIDSISEEGFTGELVLNGYRFSDCMELDRVEYFNNNKDTISILPIMKQVSDFCPMKMTPYQVKINPSFSSMKNDKVLLHARTLDGKSVNSVVNKR